MKRLFLFVFLILVSVLVIISLKSRSKIPNNVVLGSGRIEGDDVELSPKIGGKVERIFVKEGDTVKKGEVVALMEFSEIEAKRQQAVRALRAASIREKEALLDYQLTKKKVELEISKAREACAVALSESKKALANYEKAKRDYKRLKVLYERRVISKSRFEEAERAFEIAKAAYKASLSRLMIAKRDLALAKSNLKLIKIKRKLVEIAHAEKERAKYFLKEIESLLKDTKVVSPIDGVVIEKLVQEGEVISRGTPIVVVIDLNSLYLKMFVNEKDIGKISIGMPARIYTDAYPEKPFKAKVCYVSQRAEFTPKEVETFSERVHHVFAVKLCPESNKNGLLKPGMPADGVIKIGKGPWFNPIKGKRE